MNHNNSGKSDHSSEEKERRVDHLINLVERETRTERHLEQDWEASDPKNLKNAEKVNQNRKDEIEHLKDIIVHGEQNNNKQTENLKKRYKYADGYLKHNSDHMDEDVLVNTVVKQEHRKEQLDSLK